LKLFHCPHCGKGKLYRTFFKIADNCSACGLPFYPNEQGDGPASASVLIVGGLVAIFASIVEVKYEPPFWVHAALWIPFILIASLASNRIIKALMIVAQYKMRRD